jgi:uncharacterized protein YhaN
MIWLRSLGLDHYGVFDQHRLPLGQGLTVVVGANEAGKSTALHALSDLLWGVPARHWLADVTPRGTLQVSVELEDSDTHGGLADETTFTLVRTSRGLHPYDDLLKTAPNPWGIDGDQQRRRWLTSFGLTHAALRDGGHLVCEGNGDLAELVFTARQGHGVQRLLDEVEQRADSLFKDRRGNKSVAVRVAVEEYQRRSRELEAALVRASRVTQAEARVHELTDRNAAAAEQEKQARRHANLLDERHRCLNTAHALHHIRREIAAIRATGAAVGGDDLAVHTEARAALQEARAEHSRLAEQIRTWSAELDDLTVDEAVLADGEQIDTLHAQAEARAADRDRAAAARKAAEESDGAARSELEILFGRSDPRDTAALLQALTVPADVAAQLDDAATARVDLVAAGGRARERVQQERDALDALAQDVDLPDRDALAPLTAAVQALTADSSPLSLLRASRAQEMAARDRSRQALLQAGAIDPAASPPSIPGEDDLREAIDRLETAQEAESDARRRLQDADAAVATAQDTAHGLEHTETIDPQALSQARTDRDSTWATIARSWVGAAAPPDQERRDVAAEYARQVLDVDALADQLIEQAGRDARLAEAQQHLTRAQDEVAQRASDHSQAYRTLEDEQATWSAQWAALGVAVPSTKRAGTVRQTLLDAATAHLQGTTAHEAAAALEPQIADWTATLAGLLVGLGRPVREELPQDGDPAPDPIARLELRLAAAKALIHDVDQARELQERRRGAQTALTRAENDAASRQQELTDWGTRWQALTAVACLPDVIDPAGWAVRRTHLQAAESAHRDAQRSRGQAADAERAWETFAASVSALGSSHGLAGEPEQVLRTLRQRLDQSRADRRTYQERTRAIEAARKSRDEQATRQETAVARLDGLRQRLSLADDDELERAAGRGQLLAERAVEEEALVATLSAAADPGRDLEDLVATLVDLDSADLQVRIEEATQQEDRVRETREQTARDLGAAQATLTELQRSGDAADLNARVHEQLAEVADLAAQYAGLHLQRLILRQALETQAARHTSPLLDTAGRLLEQLTDHRWVALQAEDDGAGNRSLRIIRHDAKSFPPAAISEGTADQVFLALRLAGILHLQAERRRDGQQPLPVVLDDALMAFDDDRARNAFAVLADIAARTETAMQVVVFTHHQHLAALAAGLDRDDIHVHHLSLPPLPGERPDPDQLRASAAQSGAVAPPVARSSSAYRSTKSLPRPDSPSEHDPWGSSADPAEVRAWAREHGIEVGDRGRLPADLIRRYRAAQHA